MSVYRHTQMAGFGKIRGHDSFVILQRIIFRYYFPVLPQEV